jgi:glycosyltransferase involved in cell wall biosynthesis
MTTDSPKVSVVIPTFNEADSGYLAQAIQSVVDSTFRDFEVIVIDDGSTDETGAVVDRFSDGVRYHRQENRGTAAARNTGVKLARGEYIALLDDDDLFLPHRLERQVPVLDRNPQVALVYGQAIRFHEATGEEEVWPIGEAIAEGRIFDRLFYHNMIPALTVLARRSVIENLGGFNESLRCTDDWELWLRICSDHEVRAIPEPLARFRWHAGNTSRDAVLMLQCEIAALESVRSLHPDLFEQLGPPALRQLGNKYKRVGRRLQKKGSGVEAHRHYGEAMRLGVRSPKLWLNWLRTL